MKNLLYHPNKWTHHSSQCGLECTLLGQNCQNLNENCSFMYQLQQNVLKFNSRQISGWREDFVRCVIGYEVLYSHFVWNFFTENLWIFHENWKLNTFLQLEHETTTLIHSHFDSANFDQKESTLFSVDIKENFCYDTWNQSW